MKIFSVFVALWGILVTVGPWLIESNNNPGSLITYMIVSGLGVVIVFSGFIMLSHSQRARQTQTVLPVPEVTPGDSEASQELSGGYPWSEV
jgi:hypothetical protein